MTLKPSWNHTLCEVCWFKREPERMPVQIKREPEDFTVDQCCFCGTIKVTRIWTRQNPSDPQLLCGGEHDDDE